jgi:hypothetical protein
MIVSKYSLPSSKFHTLISNVVVLCLFLYTCLGIGISSMYLYHVLLFFVPTMFLFKMVEYMVHQCLEPMQVLGC